jgi:hypothetical protein
MFCDVTPYSLGQKITLLFVCDLFYDAVSIREYVRELRLLSSVCVKSRTTVFVLCFTVSETWNVVHGG